VAGISWCPRPDPIVPGHCSCCQEPEQLLASNLRPRSDPLPLGPGPLLWEVKSLGRTTGTSLKESQGRWGWGSACDSDRSP
jgi:hypothetical protein